MTRAPHSAVAIDAALERGDAALIAYLPVGFPSVEDSIRAGKILADVGVDAIELGFPYSDPGMDGPTIQRATVAALERGTHLEDLFHAVDELTSYGVSTCSMTYWNPVEWWGVERFAKDFAAVGGSGLITPDLPPEEGAQWEAASDKYDLERIYLTAPSSPEHRLTLIAQHSRGWVYAASSMGVTGARAAVGEHVADVVARTRAAGAQRVCVGLGVSTGAQAREIGAYADGVIVGSALVKTLFEEDSDRGLKALGELARELKAGVTGARALPSSLLLESPHPPRACGISAPCRCARTASSSPSEWSSACGGPRVATLCAGAMPTRSTTRPCGRSRWASLARASTTS